MIFSFQLNLKRSEDMIFLLEPYAYVSIHSPFVPVNPFRHGHYIKVGHKYNIYIRLEEENMLPYPYTTNCNIYEDLWKKGNPHKPRSKQMCKELCLYNLIEPNRTITPEFQMLEIPLQLCFDPECQISEEDKNILLQCRRDCKPSCRNLKYTSTITETVLEPIGIRDPDSDRDKIQVQIFLGDRQVVAENHVPLYDIGHLFSYIGGLMGCWLGVSIWAFVGIAENVFRRSIQWVERMKIYFKQTFITQQSIFSTHRSNVLNIKIY
ncbi:unnamed protein product [Larinioides sclopetarius]|uniref:Uncharacterized protein n=1 Tax=Larinioides sclopetarius TaxID=280406 RepID=A0AAV1ZWC8_9ARAC